jgi:transposase
MNKQIVSIDAPGISGNKLIHPQQSSVFCGIDVSRETLAVAVIELDQPFVQREFANTIGGHKALLVWLGKRKALTRVSLEATGIYSLDLALALDAAEGIEVAVLNPKLVNRFAQTLQRSKTDAADAQVLAEYSMRMPFKPWQRPSLMALALRAVTRQIESLTVQHTREQNRLHACEGSEATPRCVPHDLRQSLAGLKRRIEKLRREAIKLVQSDDEMRLRFGLLVGMPGIGEISALHLLGELATLAPEMSVRQWVAHSGLDPAHRESGSSVHKPARISRAGNRHLRRALYMPALAAVRWDPHLKAFYESLLARHKRKMQALVAVARKLLHAIYGIFKSKMPYDGSKLFPQLVVA